MFKFTDICKLYQKKFLLLQIKTQGEYQRNKSSLKSMFWAEKM